jgi:hypothetical protein
VLRRWHEFWTAEGDTTGLAVFRVLFALCLLREVATSREKMVNALAGGAFHLPYLEVVPTVSEATYRNLHLVQYPLIALVALGLLVRPACAALLVVQGWLLFADRLNFRNHPYLFLLILFLLLLAPSAESLSVPSLFRSLRGAGSVRGRPRPLTFQRLIQVQVCIVYACAGLHKLHPAYLRGDVLRHLAEEGTLRPIDLPPVGWAVLAWLTVAVELLLPCGLWFRRSRPACIAVGIAFHLAVAYVLQIGAFSLAMIASYVLFLELRDTGQGTLRWTEPTRSDAGPPASQVDWSR